MKNIGLKTQKSAFTLIELLVVIAIIALLAAILFPVFGRARENARRTSCLSNLKQIALGIKQYTQDYDGLFPGVILASEVSGNSPIGWADAIQPYIKSAQLYQCPSDSASGNYAPADNGYSDYFYNPALSNTSTTFAADYNDGGIKDAAVQFPAYTIMNLDAVAAAASGSDAHYRFNGDGANASGSAETATEPTQASTSQGFVQTGQLFPKHLQGMNISFVDGHAKWYRSEGGATGTFKGRIYRVWTPFPTSGENPTFRAR